MCPILQSAAPSAYASEVSGGVDSPLVIDRDTKYEGDLLLKGNASVIVEDCDFEINGQILMSDDSTLILRNANIRLVELGGSSSEDGQFWFRMVDRSRFKAVNVTIETISFKSFSIYVSDEVEAVFDDVYSLEWQGLICEGNSRVRIVDSTCWSMIHTRGASVLSVAGSSVYGVNATGDSSAILEDVYITRASVAERSSLEVLNSTISSDSEGLELVIDRGTELTLHDFPTVASGIGYELCNHWSLIGDNEASNVYMNVTLNHVYLKLVQFIVTEESEFTVKGMRAPIAKIVCSANYIEVVESTLQQVELLRECSLSALSVEFETLKASDNAFVHVINSTLGQVTGEAESRISLSSSEVQSIVGRDGAVLQLNNCSVREPFSVSDNSVVFKFLFTSMGEVEYDLSAHQLNVRVVNPLEEDARIDMILDRDRVRETRNLRVSIDGDSLAVDSEVMKDLRAVSFMVPSGVSHLSISLGPVPPERVPFFLSPVGQQLISLIIILILVVAVLLAWR
jgi:hypothetical protein